jgi:hypothetical protein
MAILPDPAVLYEYLSFWKKFMPKVFLKPSFYGLALASALMVLIFSGSARAQVGGMPVRYDAGVVQSHYLMEQRARQYESWRYRPITEADIKGPAPAEEPVINFLNTQVEGLIVLPPAETIRIRQ